MSEQSRLSEASESFYQRANYITDAFVQFPHNFVLEDRRTRSIGFPPIFQEQKQTSFHRHGLEHSAFYSPSDAPDCWNEIREHWADSFNRKDHKRRFHTKAKWTGLNHQQTRKVCATCRLQHTKCVHEFPQDPRSSVSFAQGTNLATLECLHQRPSSENLEGKGTTHGELILQGVRVAPHLVPFVPYVEKQIWLPHDLSNQQLLDRDSININVLRSWLDICNSSHGEKCRRESFAPSSCNGPTHLIDVRRYCLVPAPIGATYVALSYVWGDGAGFCTTQANLPTLLENDALIQNNSHAIIVPATVRDTIELVRHLDQQYFWVDRFCIVQDGPDKQSQLDAMASIYANAYFTVCAAQGRHASSGLYGSRPVRAKDLSDVPQAQRNSGTISVRRRFVDHLTHLTTKLHWRVKPYPRDTNDSEMSIPKNSVSVFGNPGESNPWTTKTNHSAIVGQAIRLMTSKWYSRGWTFQEHFSSRRKLVFQDDTVNWECQCSCWHEAQNLSNLPTRPSIPEEKTNYSMSNLDDGIIPDFSRFARLVTLYNRRALTYPEDALDAFSGTLFQLSDTFRGGFISGLPQLFFDAALLWQPWDPMTRRKPIRQTDEEAVLPSWSWVGWEGDINSESWRSGYNYIYGHPDDLIKSEKDQHVSERKRERPTWRTISTVHWLHSETLRGEQKPITVFSPWKLDELDMQVPNGWSRHECPDSGSNYYTHDTQPTQKCWYPVPIRDSKMPLLRPMRSKYLHCSTRHAHLFLGQKFTNEASNCVSVCINDDISNVIGVLRLADTWYDAHIPFPTRMRSLHHEGRRADFDDDLYVELKGAECEFIELSAGSIRVQSTERDNLDELATRFADFSEFTPREGNLYEFYNVMWIERKDGIAFRKAIGRVVKEKWDSLALQQINIVLG